jgi:hypothetical protein
LLAAGAQERLGLAGTYQVGDHGGVRPVLCAQVPLERAEQRRQFGRVVHVPDRSLVITTAGKWCDHEAAA